MTLEQQVCSLELAKRLKELGVKQESYFWWQQHYVEGRKGESMSAFKITTTKTESIKGARCFAAFTVAELGEMLPSNFHGRYCRFQKGLMGNVWFATLHKMNGNRQQHQEAEKTEANARAKMLIYLIENSLITV